MDKINPISELKRLGQSVWLDQIDREMINSGRLARYRDAGVSGVTANPTIFAKALEGSDAYADDVARRLDAGQGAESIVWDLLIGANINVTLIFAVERYVKVVEAFLAGLDQLRASGGDLSRVHSVASFFVSRVDTKVDALLEKKMETANGQVRGFLGKAAIANSKLAYEIFGQLHSGPRWDALRDAGATVQRCLWASTSTKNPRYRDTLYVEELIGPATVNTMPVATFEAFRDHGRVDLTLQKDVDGARRVLAELAANGIDMAAITQELEDEGVDSFAKSYRESIDHLKKVRTPR